MDYSMLSLSLLKGDIWDLYQDIASYLLQETSDKILSKKGIFLAFFLFYLLSDRRGYHFILTTPLVCLQASFPCPQNQFQFILCSIPPHRSYNRWIITPTSFIHFIHPSIHPPIIIDYLHNYKSWGIQFVTQLVKTEAIGEGAVENELSLYSWVSQWQRVMMTWVLAQLY